MNCTAVIKQDAGWWIGWIEEAPRREFTGRDPRGASLENLRSALREAIELNRADAIKAAGPEYSEATVAV